MDRTRRAALAAGTAAVLLLGGPGTLAFWGSKVTPGTSSVSTGHLDLVAVPGSSGGWTDVTGGGSAAISDISAFRLVPGDSVEFRRDYTVSATGPNLRATLTPTGVVTPSSDLASWVHTTVTTTGTGTSGVVTSADDGSTMHVAVRIDFDAATPGAVTNGGVNAGDDDTLDLSALALTLAQTQGTAHGN